MKAHPLVEFPRTEDEYDEYKVWIEQHPHGFVINTWKKPANVPTNLRGMTKKGFSPPHAAGFQSKRLGASRR